MGHFEVLSAGSASSQPARGPSLLWTWLQLRVYRGEARLQGWMLLRTVPTDRAPVVELSPNSIRRIYIDAYANLGLIL